jgi:tRNA modification GTPase
MNTFAAVMTGKGVGAIATIQIFSESAEKLLKKIFIPVGKGPAEFKTGKILLGTIVDGAETIDQVIVGCEDKNIYAINCHGNPLIVADIMRLLSRQGVTPLDAEELLAKILSSRQGATAIEIEAKLAQLKAKTLAGAKIIASQIRGGLSEKARHWLESIDAMSLDEIKSQAQEILERSRAAKLIIYGARAVIAGPQNSGKSTLLNCLAGRQKAIVTDIKGTTRDWVSAQCRIGPLSVELIDTAGLDEEFGAKAGIIEKASQEKAVQLLEEADLVLLVLDGSQMAEQLGGRLIEKIAGKKVLTVLNKSDLPTRFDADKLPKILASTVKISAKLGTGIDGLIEKMQQLLLAPASPDASRGSGGVAEFDVSSGVCFTRRQENLLKQLKEIGSSQQVVSVITELLNGQV